MMDQPNNSVTDKSEKYVSSFSYKLLPELSWKTRIFYSFGHIYNDLCASVWFSYTLLYFKLNFDDNIAGLLLLLGQVADAISTPLVGYGSDKNFSYFVCRYGRRKIWHLIGTVCVSCSFPFIFNACFVCDESGFLIKFSYYACFIAIFQFGWASVQVSHVSLLVDLTQISSQRVELNAYRQAATVASSICVYSITLILLGVEETTISKKDTIVFMKVVHLISVIGIIFSILFHIFVGEPSYEETVRLRQASADDQLEDKQTTVFRERAGSCYSTNLSEFGSNRNLGKTDKTLLEDGVLKKRTSSLLEPEIKVENTKPLKRNRKQKIWSDWLKSTNFWQMCLIYMMSRLFVNLTQVYTPLYLQDSLRLAKRNIAIVPFITYFTGFIFSLIAKPISTKVGSKSIMSVGCAFGLLSCVWIFFGGLSITLWQVFSVAALFGLGGTAMLIGSLSLTADLIGDNTVSGAFVFGSMSFFDKLVNGGVIALIQHFNPLSQTNLTDIITKENYSYATYTPDHKLGLNTSITDLFNISSLHNNITTSSSIELSDHTEIVSEQISVQYYLQVLVYVSGAAVVMTFIALLATMKAKFAKRNSSH